MSAETRGRKGGDYGSGILGNLLLDPSKDFLTPFKFDDYEQGVANPGDIIEYVHTIRSSAVFEIGSGLIYVCDTLPDELDYVEDTAEWEVVLKNDTILASGPVNASEFFDREGPNGPGVIGGGCFPIPSKIPAKADLLIRYCATVVNTEDFPEQGDSECKEVTNTGELIYDFRREGENFKYDKDTTICRVCKNNSTEIDPGCNATLPDCDAEFGEFGSKCLPKTTYVHVRFVPLCSMRGYSLKSPFHSSRFFNIARLPLRIRRRPRRVALPLPIRQRPRRVARLLPA